MKTKNIATAFAILAAALYAINVPFSKLLLAQVEPTMMAAFLYLGAGLGLFVYGLLTGEREKSEPLTKKRASVYYWYDRSGYCRTHPADAGLGAHQCSQCIPSE